MIAERINKEIDILLITPPFTQLNTPYPATAYLKGFLKTKHISSYQVDLGIEVILNLFSKLSFETLFESVLNSQVTLSENSQRILGLRHQYIRTIDAVVNFLQGKQPTLARTICNDNFLPQASRFENNNDLEWAFGNMGIQDRAKHLATLYLEDLSDFIVECVDEHFGFSRYAERLGRSANTFDELHTTLQQYPSHIDNITLAILEKKINFCSPKLICFSVPFPGNLYSAFRCAQYIKENYPDIKTAMGGGFPNTELREIKDPRVFQFFDFITLDDGELPIELLHEHITSQRHPKETFLKRTFLLENGEVTYNNFSLRKDYSQNEVGTPDYSDLKLGDYISIIEMANPMHSLWSDGRWNKLTMAHGCYWGKCTFCDISLDYIKNYEPINARLLVDRMQELLLATGESGFHFVDEAAPPSLMGAVAIEILKRGLVVSWWTNIRFEKTFTFDLCRLLRASGCIAVSGGLEVASDRLLALIQKGVSVEQVAQVTSNFTEAGIMVHAYLMYGYPTQTIQETIDSLEMVRQLFELGVIQSGFWHQFALTAHSPVGLDPDTFGIIPKYQKITFANNDIDFRDKTGIDHAVFSKGLKASLYNYMHDIGFDLPLYKWFDFEIPHTTIAPSYIENCLENKKDQVVKPSAKVYWIGELPMLVKTDVDEDLMIMTFYNTSETFEITLSTDLAHWIYDLILKIDVKHEKISTFQEMTESYKQDFEDFSTLYESSVFDKLRSSGLLII
jgi:hypothetical protein